MSLLPGKFNFQVWRGGTLQKRIALWQDDAETIPVGLSGYSSYFQVLDSETEAELTRFTSDPGGGLVIDKDNGTIDLNIPAATTQAFPWDYALYQWVIVSGSGYVYPILYGLIVEKFVV